MPPKLQQTLNNPQSNTAEDQPWLPAVVAAQAKQAVDIRIFDLRGLSSFTDYFIICTGTNIRQTQAIADGVEEAMRDEGVRAHSVEGYTNGEWILGDYSDFMLHVFTPQTRQYYSLDRLWREAKEIEVPADPALR